MLILYLHLNVKCRHICVPNMRLVKLLLFRIGHGTKISSLPSFCIAHVLTLCLSCVLVPPTVDVKPRQVTLKQGTPFRLACTSTSPASVKWSKVNDTIRSDIKIQGSTLEVMKATVEHSGKYRCFAENRAGSSESFAIVAVFSTYSITAGQMVWILFFC